MAATADFVVIGGGVVGAAILHELTERGLGGILLERDLPNRQGSGTTAGNLHIQAIHAERPDQEIAVDTRQLVPLQARTSELWRSLQDGFETPLDISVKGGLTVAETPAQVAHLREKAAWEAEAGIPTSVISGDEARARVPQLGAAVLAATWCEWDGWANNLVITPAYLDAARRGGAKVRTHSPVIGMHRLASGWRVSTPTGDIDTPVVVDAAGPWMDRIAELAGFPLLMAPLAIQMLETVRVAPVLEHLIQHIGEGLSVKQVSTGNVVIGGGWPAAHFDLQGVSPVSSQSVDGSLDQVRRVLPGLTGIRLSRAWTGPLAATPDEMPVIGEMPGDSGFHVAGGTYAFTFSPLWARITADNVLGTTALGTTALGTTRDATHGTTPATTPDIDVSRFAPARLLATTPIGL